MRWRRGLLAACLCTLLLAAPTRAQVSHPTTESDAPSDDVAVEEAAGDELSAEDAGLFEDDPLPDPPPRLETLPGLYPLATGVYVGQGFWAGTPDRRFTLRMSGFVHLDTRTTFDGTPDGRGFDVFWRRVRLTLDGRIFGQFEYRIMWDQIVDPLIPYDMHLDWRPVPEINLRLGKFKTPLGLERRNRSYALLFIERGFPTGLSPNRDFGIFIYGQTRDGFFSYDVALLSGAVDLEVLGEWRGSPDLAGRVYLQPFRLIEGYSVLHNLGIGFSWTLGEEHGTESDPRLQGIRATPRRSQFGGRLLFDYLADARGVTVAQGRRDRQSVQAHWRHGQFQANFEYVRAAQQVARIDASGQAFERSSLAHHAWQAVASMTLNAEDENTFFGVAPTRPFDPSRGHWGGATLSIRYQELYVDQAAFPRFANPDVSVDTVRAIATSFQWHLSLRLEAQLDVEWQVPTGGGPNGGNMPSELALMTRLEARY